MKELMDFIDRNSNMQRQQWSITKVIHTRKVCCWFPLFNCSLNFLCSLLLLVLISTAVSAQTFSEIDRKKIKVTAFVPGEGKKVKPKGKFKEILKILDYNTEEPGEILTKDNKRLMAQLTGVRGPMETWRITNCNLVESSTGDDFYAATPSPDKSWLAYILYNPANIVVTTITLKFLSADTILSSLNYPIWTCSEKIEVRNGSRGTLCFQIDPGIAWSPNGKILAYTYQSLDYSDQQEKMICDIEMLTLPTNEKGSSGIYRVTNDPEDREFQPTFDPKSKFLSYVKQTVNGYRIHLVTLDTWKYKVIGGECEASFSPQFHPEEAMMSFVIKKDDKFYICYTNIDEDPAEDQSVTRLTQEGLQTPYVFPTWSPDGSRLAYWDGEAIQSINLRSEVTLISKEASDPKQSNFFTNYCWLPNSSQIIFTKQNSQVSARILYHNGDDEANALISYRSDIADCQQITRQGERIFFTTLDKRRKLMQGTVSIAPADTQTTQFYGQFLARFTGRVRIGDTSELVEAKQVGITGSEQITAAEITMLPAGSGSMEEEMKIDTRDGGGSYETGTPFDLEMIKEMAKEKKTFPIKIENRYWKKKKAIVVKYTSMTDQHGGGVGTDN